jgi:hypothetical protein
MIRCPAGHHFSGPIAFFTPDSTGTHDPGTAGASSRAGRDSPLRGHDGRDGGGSALRDYPAAPERKDRRQNNTPAYYLGRPATVWITAMRPRRRRTAPRHLMEAAARSGNPAWDSGALRRTAAGQRRRARVRPSGLCRCGDGDVLELACRDRFEEGSLDVGAFFGRKPGASARGAGYG